MTDNGRRLRRDARGQIMERRTARGVVWGLRLEAEGAELIPVRLTPHGLRHTFASVICAVGENPRFVMVQIGHADAALTFRMHAKSMDRRDGEPERLKALVDG